MEIDPHLTCWTIVCAASAGDAAARSVFVGSYSGPVRAYLVSRWRGHALQADIDDAVQEAFFECLKANGALESADPRRGDFRGLLYGVVRNVARRFEERLAKDIQRRPKQSVYLDELPHQADALSLVFDRAWAQSILREAVSRHEAEAKRGDPDALRRFHVLQFRHDQGLPIRKIAEQLSEPDVAKIHNDYRRARREFAVHLRVVTARHTGARGTDVDTECRKLNSLLSQ